LTNYPFLEGVTEINVFNLEIDGNPSAIYIATIEIKFLDGGILHVDLDYRLYGVIYESFLEELSAMRKFYIKNNRRSR